MHGPQGLPPPFHRHVRGSPRRARGFTLIELIIVLIVIGVLVVLATGGYAGYTARSRNAVAIRDIGRIQLAVDRYALDNGGTTPPDLAAIDLGDLLDPWGNAYVYLSFTGLQGHGAMRKDRNLVPINTEYDLYSKGPDGATAAPLTARASRDDILRANDGAYIGLAADY
jgi:general secretion pathway protein G